jgi:Glycosyltransferase family 87
MAVTGPTSTEIRIALAFTAALLLGVSLLQTVTLEARNYDFSARYASGVILRQGDGSKVYCLDEERRVQEALFGRNGVMVETHPPFEMPLYALLAKLPYNHAYIVLAVINISIWMFFVLLIRSCAPVPEQTLRYLLLCFTFFPLWAALLQGQTSLLLLLLYGATFFALKRKRDFVAGVFLGLGLFRFQLVLPFVLICILRKKWKLTVGFASVALLLAAISVLAVGRQGVMSYAHLMIDTVRHPSNPSYASIRPTDMPTVRGFLAAILTGWVSQKWMNAGTALVSAFLILFTAWRWRQEDRRGDDDSQGLIFAAALTVTLITGFYVLAHDMSLMLLAVLLTFAPSQRSKESRWWLVLKALAVVLCIPFAYMLLLHWHRMSLLFPILVAFALSAFALLENHLFCARPTVGDFVRAGDDR